MGEESGNREHHRMFTYSSGARIPADEHVLVSATGNMRAAGPCEASHYVSDAEIAQLVSVALEDAIAALSEPDPENSIRLRAYEARAGIREMLSTLPSRRSRDPKVLEDYRRAIMFQNVALDLALNLVASIRRYSKVYEREIPPRTA